MNFRRELADRLERLASALELLAWKVDPGRGVSYWGTYPHPDGLPVLTTHMKDGSVLEGHVHRPKTKETR